MSADRVLNFTMQILPKLLLGLTNLNDTAEPPFLNISLALHAKTKVTLVLLFLVLDLD